MLSAKDFISASSAGVLTEERRSIQAGHGARLCALLEYRDEGNADTRPLKKLMFVWATNPTLALASDNWSFVDTELALGGVSMPSTTGRKRGEHPGSDGRILSRNSIVHRRSTRPAIHVFGWPPGWNRPIWPQRQAPAARGRRCRSVLMRAIGGTAATTTQMKRTVDIEVLM
jgi:hypothetical protein